MISLEIWATRYNPPPTPNTLRKWARVGDIIPQPVKLGRTYYVSENARHIAEVTNGLEITFTKA